VFLGLVILNNRVAIVVKEEAIIGIIN